MFGASVATITAWYPANCDTCGDPLGSRPLRCRRRRCDEIEKALGAHRAEVCRVIDTVPNRSARATPVSLPTAPALGPCAGLCHEHRRLHQRVEGSVPLLRAPTTDAVDLITGDRGPREFADARARQAMST